MPYSTITILIKTKERLALVKGSRSWEDFLEDVVQRYPVDDFIKDLQARIDDVLHDRVKTVPWADVKRKARAKRS